MVIVYWPGSSPTSVYMPSALVRVSLVTFVSSLIAVTVALGIADREVSTTWPRMLALKS